MMNWTEHAPDWSAPFPHGKIAAVMEALKMKHKSTFEHCVRTGRIAERFAETLGMDGAARLTLMQGCSIHDIGKLVTPDSVLKRRGKLSETSWETMKAHPLDGADLAVSLCKELSRETVDIVLHHHERWDGGGYPAGLGGERIPYMARICAVIDAFDSMMFDRCYRKRLPYARVREELLRNGGAQFDPDIVRAFVPLADRLMSGAASSAIKACS